MFDWLIGGGFFTVLLFLGGLMWRSQTKKIDGKMDIAVCEERHKALDEDIQEIKKDVKDSGKVLRNIEIQLARMNGQ